MEVMKGERSALYVGKMEGAAPNDLPKKHPAMMTL